MEMDATRASRRTRATYSADIAAPIHQAYLALRTGFVVLPILAGADKFLNALTDWEAYLAPVIPATLHIPASTLMRGVGVVEIVAGLLVAVAPRNAAYVVMAWLWLIIGDLLLLGRYFDVALRDLGLSIGAFALARLAAAVQSR
jgi:hypothetical protein